MTWKELKEIIAGMNDSELDTDVVYVPDEQDSECVFLGCLTADEDIERAWGDYAEDENASDIVVKKDMPYLG